jgi:hypothetical protein
MARLTKRHMLGALVLWDNRTVQAQCRQLNECSADFFAVGCGYKCTSTAASSGRLWRRLVGRLAVTGCRAAGAILCLAHWKGRGSDWRNRDHRWSKKSHALSGWNSPGNVSAGA